MNFNESLATFYSHPSHLFPIASQRHTENRIMDSTHAAHAYFSTEIQAIAMETSVVHHGNMTWMSMVEVNGFAAIKGACTYKALIHRVYTLTDQVAFLLNAFIKSLENPKAVFFTYW